MNEAEEDCRESIPLLLPWMWLESMPPMLDTLQIPYSPSLLLRLHMMHTTVERHLGFREIPVQYEPRHRMGKLSVEVLSFVFHCQIFIRSAIRLSMKHKGMNTCHSPSMLRCPGTMSCPPCCHPTIVDCPQSLGGNLCAS